VDNFQLTECLTNLLEKGRKTTKIFVCTWMSPKLQVLVTHDITVPTQFIIIIIIIIIIIDAVATA